MLQMAFNLRTTNLSGIPSTWEWEHKTLPGTYSKTSGSRTINQAAAEKACRPVTAEDHDLCVFDVMATSDIDMAGAY
jgi:hypothetical protein